MITRFYSSAFPAFKGASISHLFGSRCPSDIARLVIAVIVNAIHRLGRRWPVPDIMQEIGKRVPLVTDLNSAPAIVAVAMVVDVFAAMQHVAPRSIFGRAFLAVRPGRVPVGAPSLRVKIANVASARVAIATQQRSRAHDSLHATVASAKELAIESRQGNVFKNEPARISLAYSYSTRLMASHTAIHFSTLRAA